MLEIFSEIHMFWCTIIFIPTKNYNFFPFFYTMHYSFLFWCLRCQMTGYLPVAFETITTE